MAVLSKRRITGWELETINRIADRALAFFPDRDRNDILMDITATINGGCRLRVEDMLAGGDLDFVHDIIGINRHLNRQTFELEDCFVPRFARQ